MSEVLSNLCLTAVLTDLCLTAVLTDAQRTAILTDDNVVQFLSSSSFHRTEMRMTSVLCQVASPKSRCTTRGWRRILLTYGFK